MSTWPPTEDHWQMSTGPPTEGHWRVSTGPPTEGHWQVSTGPPTEGHWQVSTGPPTEGHWLVSALVSVTPSAEQTQQALAGQLTMELGLQSQNAAENAAFLVGALCRPGGFPKRGS